MFGVFNKTEQIDECIESVDHNISIHDNFCSLTSTQKYKNSLEKNVEWEYRYPTNSSPYDIHVEIYDPKTKTTKIMDLDIKPKEQAAEAYEDAIAEGKSAVLVEKTEGRSVNCMSLGNIPGEATVSVKISRVEKLRLRKSIEDEDLFEMEFFLPAEDHAKDYGQKMLESGYKPREIVSLAGKVQFSDGVKLKDITSMSHETSAGFISIDIESGEFSTMKPFGQDREFQLTFSFDQYPTLSSWTEEIDSNLYATMVTFLPQVPQEDEEEARREIIVIVDCSGSMGGSRIETCRRALQVFMNSMPTTEGTFLNIHRFGTRREKIFKKCTAMSVKTHQNAMEYIKNKMSANLGGTNIYEVMQEVIGAKVTENCQRNVFFFGDGEGSRTNDTISLIRKNVAKIGRIFSFGIGSGINPAFLREISTVTGGNAVFFDHADKDLQAKIIKQLQYSLEPTLEKVQVKLEGGGVKPLYSYSSFPEGTCFNREEQTACFLSKKEPKNVDVRVGKWKGVGGKRMGKGKQKKGMFSSMTGGGDAKDDLEFFAKNVEKKEEEKPKVEEAGQGEGIMSGQVIGTARKMTGSGGLKYLVAQKIFEGLELKNQKKDLVDLGMKIKMVNSETSFILTCPNDEAFKSHMVKLTIPTVSYSRDRRKGLYSFGKKKKKKKKGKGGRGKRKMMNFAVAQKCAAPPARMQLSRVMKEEEEEEASDDDCDMAIMAMDFSFEEEKKKKAPRRKMEKEKKIAPKVSRELTEREEGRKLQDLLISCDMLGKFTFDKKTASLIGLMDLKKVEDENSDELWMTALVVAFLQLKHKKRRAEWGMIAGKSMKLLKKNKKDKLIDTAKVFLKKELNI